MIIVGEKLNSSLEAARLAMKNRDAGAVIKLAKMQVDAGSSYLDLNAGMFYDAEVEVMEWLVKTIQEAVEVPFAIDSVNPAAMKRAFEVNTNPRPLMNSVTAGDKSFSSMTPILKEHPASVVALCMDDNGIPETVDQRVKIADILVERLTKLGLTLGDIYIDPLVCPIGSGSHNGVAAIETVRKVVCNYPGIHIMCGLSNISFGLPARKIINQVFLVSMMNAGMDGAILDPLDKRLMSCMYACKAILGADDYCENFLDHFRKTY